MKEKLFKVHLILNQSRTGYVYVRASDLGEAERHIESEIKTGKIKQYSLIWRKPSSKSLLQVYQVEEV